MIKSPLTLTTATGNLFGRLFAPDGPSRAVLCIVHGMGEHCGRYETMAQWLTDHEIGVVTADLPGHGKSPGKRGALPPYEQLLDAVGALEREAGTKFGPVPVFLLGHSYGGGLAANYALRRTHSLSGLILSSPWFRLTFQPKAIDVFLAKLLVGIFPNYTQRSGLDTSGLSRIPEAVMRYKEDDLVHDKISPRTFLDAKNNGEAAIGLAPKLAIPLLAIHGTDDRLTDPRATEAFAKAATGDVTWQAFPGGYHELHNDLDQAVVLNAYTSWIQARW